MHVVILFGSHLIPDRPGSGTYVHNLREAAGAPLAFAQLGLIVPS